jgi:DNA-directed RNA polymerase specialized sigma24 family protein
MKWLEIVAKQHNDWVLMAKKMGAKHYAEDIVQEAYIKLHKYTDPNKVIKKGKVSKGYMFFVIRSIYLHYVVNKNKIHKINIDDFYKDDGFKEITQENLHKFTDQDYLDEEQAFGRLINKMDNELDSWDWYSKRIFEIYRDTPLSIRGMAKETGISFVNIFHTLKKGKQIMRDKFSEDYEDFKNKDYNKI